MSSFFDEASLVFIPSGYKTSKAYSVKPTDGTGDLTFTRSNDTATRVGPDGLIEKVRTNVALYSEQFDNASWSKGTLTVTANAGTAPNGTTTADLIYPSANSSNSVIFNGVTIANSTEYTNSIYVKASGKTWTFIRGINDGVGVWFDVANGVVGTTQSGVSGTITSVGSGWYRCSVTQTSSGTAGRLVVLVVDGDGSTVVTASGTNGLLIWGAQQETGVMTDYIATTSAAVSVGPVANVPRLDYLNSSCPRLLLEPQRTNLALYSEQLNNAWWTAAGSTITANTSVAPDGTTSMDRLTETATTNPHQVISSSVTIFGGGARAFSAFVKKGNVRYIQLANVAFGDSSASAIFDLDTKTVTASRASSGAGPAFSFVSASVEDYGNGILRLILVNTCSFDAPTYHIAHSNQATFSGATLADGVISYAGNASSYTDIWGAQIESASYATSYIPTLGAAVTRGKDSCLTASVPSLIGQTEGTMFIEFERKSLAADSFFILSNVAGTTGSSYQNSIYIYQLASSTIVVEGYISNVQQFAFTTSALSVGTHKVAIAYKANDFALYIDGVQIGTDTSGNVPAMNFLTIGGGADVSGHLQGLNQALLFKTRLSNISLAELTSL